MRRIDGKRIQVFNEGKFIRNGMLMRIVMNFVLLKMKYIVVVPLKIKLGLLHQNIYVTLYFL